MTMNMYIVMNMNIYISRENEERLRSEASMSGLINHLLEQHYSGTPGSPQAPNEPVYEQVPPAKLKTKNIVSADAEVKMKVMDNDALKALLGTKAKPIKDEPRHVCPPACKHWVWDIDRGGRVNTYTGEFEEGEPW